MGQNVVVSCVKLVDGPFVLTDLLTIPTNAWSGPTAETWVFAAPPSASWDASTQAQWFVSQMPTVLYNSPPLVNSGMHYAVTAGSSLYAVSQYGAAPNPTLWFSWSGFKTYQ
jgi:hypothetical protein